MSHGGKREGAGRKAGSFSTRRKEFTEKIAAEGLTPLDYLLRVVRNEGSPPAERLDAAKAAAPYIHSKMPNAIINSAPGSSEIGEDDEEILNLYASGIHAEADQE